MSPPRDFDASKPEWQLLFDMVADLNEKLEAHNRESTEYREAVAAQMAGDMAIFKAFKDRYDSAFPNGDPDAHRLYHEAVMAEIEERRELIKTMKKEIAKWGIIGLLGFMLVAMRKELFLWLTK